MVDGPAGPEPALEDHHLLHRELHPGNRGLRERGPIALLPPPRSRDPRPQGGGKPARKPGEGEMGAKRSLLRREPDRPDGALDRPGQLPQRRLGLELHGEDPGTRRRGKKPQPAHGDPERRNAGELPAQRLDQAGHPGAIDAAEEAEGHVERLLPDEARLPRDAAGSPRPPAAPGRRLRVPRRRLRGAGPCDALPDALRQRDRGPAIRFRKQDQELLSAVAAHEIRRANGFPDGAREFLQYTVTHLMAIGVIDPLEMVQVYHHQSKRMPVSSGTPEFAAHGLQERTPIRDTRELVGGGQLFQALK